MVLELAFNFEFLVLMYFIFTNFIQHLLTQIAIVVIFYGFIPGKYNNLDASLKAHQMSPYHYMQVKRT